MDCITYEHIRRQLDDGVITFSDVHALLIATLAACRSRSQAIRLEAYRTSIILHTILWQTNHWTLAAPPCTLCDEPSRSPTVHPAMLPSTSQVAAR